MSELTPYGFSLDSAIDYNAKKAQIVGWYGNIPAEAIASYPCFVHDAVNGSRQEKERFAVEVLSFQKRAFSDSGSHDGKFGQATWTEMQQRYNTITDDLSYVLWNNIRYQTPSAEVISYEDGYDLHKAGNFSKRKSPIRLIVIHWGGSSVRGLYKYFNDPNRDLSTHFGIGPDGAYQLLDLHHCAWHAGYVNGFSVGIDICQQPTRDYYDYYAGKGYDVLKAINQTKRGRSEIITLETVTAAHLRNLVPELCRVMGVPLKAPRGAKPTRRWWTPRRR